MMFTQVEEAIAYIESKRNKRTVDQFRDTLNRCHIHMKQKNMIHIAGIRTEIITIDIKYY